MKSRIVRNYVASGIGSTPLEHPLKPPPGESSSSRYSTSTTGPGSPPYHPSCISFLPGFRFNRSTFPATSGLFTSRWPTSTVAAGRPRWIPYSKSSEKNFSRKDSIRSTGPVIVPISLPPIISFQKASSSDLPCRSYAKSKSGFLRFYAKKLSV